MTIANLALIVLTVFLLSAGQILFKLAANGLNAAPSFHVSALFDRHVILALLVYGVATVLWILSLRTVPLRLAYPFAGLAFVLVPLMSHFFLAEPLKPSTFIGAALILAGVWVSVGNE